MRLHSLGFESVKDKEDKKPSIRSKKVPGCSAYTLFEDGRLYSDKHKKFLTAYLVKKYYYYRMMSDEGKSVTKLAHRMVAELFVPIPSHLKDKTFSELEVNHKDGKKENWKASNLEWCTRSENMKHAFANGLSTVPALMKKKEKEK